MIRYLIAGLAVALILTGWRLDHVSNSLDRAKAVISDQVDTINTLESAAQSRRNTQKLLAQLDTEHTKALTDAQTTNAELLARIGAGAKRLSVPARCSATTVRAATSTTRVDDAAERAELDPASAQRIVATATDGDAAIIALTGLQDYVARTCLKGN
ncbi:lysis system i-spanin subunit Rz [Pseudomonas brassicacearum]|uniref:lysis system i-spanin subunit Rz n=1 Tax=Pseudomonas brassicacearum TaxID=930166 RepID=UPI0007218228|nr:lysis system i-spanin subunit Rz [Pseudomonas brassicacearum]ALQ01477.1 Phage protein [Pseudomonas brassicacearum]